jgi:hypothetical protein
VTLPKSKRYLVSFQTLDNIHMSTDSQKSWMRILRHLVVGRRGGSKHLTISEHPFARKTDWQRRTMQPIVSSGLTQIFLMVGGVPPVYT